MLYVLSRTAKANPSGKRMYLDYIKLICAVVPASATGARFAVKTDPQLRTISTNNMLAITPMGFVPLSKTGAELLFEVFSRRYERSATLVTSNLPFNEWTEAFGSWRAALAPASEERGIARACSRPATVAGTAS